MTAPARSYRHRGGDEPLLGATIPEHFAKVVRRFGEREAVVSLPQSRRLTYRQLAEAIDQLARGLVGMGFVKGERIGIWSTNNLEWLLLQMATARIGVVLVNINPASRRRELAHALGRAQVHGLFAIPRVERGDCFEMLRELIPELDEGGPRLRSAELPHLRTVVVYDPAAPMETASLAAGVTRWAEVIEAGGGESGERLAELAASLDIDDAINIQYTSGTTGFPKAVVLTHHNILNNAWFAARAMGFTEADRLCVPVPFYHCFGMVLGNLLCLSVGACVVIPGERFDAGACLRAIAAERCTAIHGVPTMFVAQLEHPEVGGLDLSSLRTGIMAGAPCPPPLMKRVIEEMGCDEVLIGYGQTEASPITQLTSRDDSFERRTETVGTNLPHQEAKVVDVKTGAVVPCGHLGELCFRGYHVMQGYFGDPEATAEAIDERGWLHSGDLGTMDGDGYVRITGRLKDMIIRGGENIYPAEIELFLSSHPKVAQVAVFGVPDEYYGEEVMAWIQLHAGETATEEEIRDYCRGNIAHYKVPRHVWFVEEFPMTVTGKHQKFRMREIAGEKAGESAAPAP